MKPTEIAKLKRLYNHWLDHDPTPAEQVGWSTTEDQRGRFEQFVRVIIESGREDAFSILDVGCGDGALLEYLNERLPNADIEYVGVDINERYLERARQLYGDSARFVKADFEVWRLNRSFDFVVASGTYNVDVFENDDQPYELLSRVIPKMWKHATCAVVFNILVEKEANGFVLTGDMFIYDKDRVKKICESLTHNIKTFVGYDPHDMTFALFVQ